MHQEVHPKTRFWLLTNFPDWGYQGDVSCQARGPQRQDYGDYDEVIRVVPRKLRAASISLAGVTVDNPYDHLVGEHPSVDFKDPKSVDWIKRVRRYEDFAREQGLEFNLIVNSERGGHESDGLFCRETLQMVNTYRKAGGQPTRWLVQSWYLYPKQTLPETAPHTMTALVKVVIERARLFNSMTTSPDSCRVDEADQIRPAGSNCLIPGSLEEGWREAMEASKPQSGALGRGPGPTDSWLAFPMLLGNGSAG